MVLGKLPVPGRPTVWMIVGQGPTVFGWRLFGHFYAPFSPLTPFLWEMAQYRLKYCLKGPLNPASKKCYKNILGTSTTFCGCSQDVLLPLCVSRVIPDEFFLRQQRL